ncbi:MAG: M23 family metallopeptidase [Hyphomicrobiaceae bacterium]|nr:M23 family metallopeptidase [Hyphomicrobiaceae bacterium]
MGGRTLLATWAIASAMPLWAAASAGACDLPGRLEATRPVAAEMTAGFGLRKHPILQIDRMHLGVDFPAPIGAPVVAAAAGRVLSAGRSGEYGNLVVVEHGGGLATYYAHLARIEVAEGACLAAGAAIGRVGTTGLSAEPHLHFEVRRNGAPVDPAPLLDGAR